MHPSSLLPILRGPLHFLRLDPEEVRRLVPDLERTIPIPQRIFLDNEAATPLRGFPVLETAGLERLRQALHGYLQAEEEVQIGLQTRQPHDRKAWTSAWERYRQILAPAVENATLSSYGRQYPAIFWLHHSLDVARFLKDTPKRVLRRDLQLGREHGDSIKYRTFERYLDRVLNTTYDLVTGLAVDTEEAEEELFPRLLTRMRDNVLLFTEDHISPNLAELGSYFAGHLRIDGRDFRRRLEALEDWHQEQLAGDRDLAEIAQRLLGVDPAANPRELLKRRGWIPYLATRRSYDRRWLLDPEQIRIWESLLVKLKEFELFHSLRRNLVAVEREGERLICRRGEARRSVVLSTATRPMDFLAPWVVDPLVDRFGLIYDITDFSEIISVLRRSGSESQDLSFRKMFSFQRRINQLAVAHRLHLEKYLGDGAFFSSRRARAMLAAAVQIQRFYRQELEQGFPFDRGLRIAVNYGQYRIIPIGRGGSDEAGRYEFFGHSVVELSRLTTGKASREIDEIKTMLVSLGYPEATVHRFFSPMMHTGVDTRDQQQEGRRFRAYINRNGSLFNEGIVATEAFISRLTQESPWKGLHLGRYGDVAFVIAPLDDEIEGLSVGLRKLGMATLKGLEQVPVYEVADANDLERGGKLDSRGLLSALDQIFHHSRLGPEQQATLSPEGDLP